MTPAGGARLDFELADNEFQGRDLLKVSEGRIVRGVVKGLRPEQLEQSHISVRSESKPGSFHRNTRWTGRIRHQRRSLRARARDCKRGNVPVTSRS